jgi:preprotein translocase subunit SecG
MYWVYYTTVTIFLQVHSKKYRQTMEAFQEANNEKAMARLMLTMAFLFGICILCCLTNSIHSSSDISESTFVLSADTGGHK